jgi:hypothetical protein
LTTACREANYSSETINIRDDSSSRDNRNIMDVNNNQKSATKEKPTLFSRDVSNSSRNSQLKL